MQIQSPVMQPNSVSAPSIPQGAGNPAVLTEPLDIHESLIIEGTQAENHPTDSSLQEIRQALTTIEAAVLDRNLIAGLIESALPCFIDCINKLNESLKQKNQTIEAADQENTALKEKLNAKEKECEALRQEFGLNKQVFKEQLQAKEAADQENMALKEKLNAKEKECEALRQEFELSKQVFKEQLQAKEAIQQLKDSESKVPFKSWSQLKMKGQT